MPRTSDARQRMIQSAALLFRERGIEGTTFADVLEHSGAPRGSVYHHFRGGKTQLAEESVRWAGEFTLAGTAAVLQEHDPVAAVGIFRRQWSEILRDSDFRAGCPIVAAAVDGEHEPTVREIAGEVFADWEQLIADAFAERGVPADRARSMATLLVAAIEGGIVLSRAQRSVKPLERVTAELETVIATAFAPVAGARSTT
ncbi:MAG: TetR/AcrR family transcriptional regulator [Solirubrobacteraceae bacterium]|nr:TetR/AcrR family transcriptional regulator [Solirubrobacteraceae bacterium]